MRTLVEFTLKALRPLGLARPGVDEKDCRELHQSMRLILGAAGWGKLDTGGKFDVKSML